MITALNNSMMGMQQASLTVAKSAQNIADPNSQTDVTQDLITMKAAEQNFKANATALSITKDLQEDLYRAVDLEV